MTFAKFPLPIVFISLYLPICGASSLRGARTTPPDELVARLRLDDDPDDGKAFVTIVGAVVGVVAVVVVAVASGAVVLVVVAAPAAASAAGAAAVAAQRLN